MPMGQMGVPMGNMGMMPMMPMPSMMPTMSGMGMNAAMGAGAFSMGPSAMSAQSDVARAAATAMMTPGEMMEKSSAKKQREWLVKELEAASEELASKAAAAEGRSE